MKKPVGLTLKEALDSGYRISDSKFALGYISRKVNIDEQPCYYAGGTRKGYIYVELPCRNSTRYYYRMYLGKEGK